MEIWEAALGDEARVRAARRLFDDPVDVDATRRFLRDKANHLFIAYVDGEPAGFVSGTEIVHPDKPAPEFFLNELGVDEAYRNRGIGKALVGRAWEVAQRRGCRGMWVLADEANVAAQKVHTSSGGVRGDPQLMFEWDG
jgi:[ribosomal protein S18]-alanine N-acetyltransferase